MMIDAKFIFTVAQLAVEFGEKVIMPIIAACHGDKTDEQIDVATTKIEHLIKAHNK